MIRRPLLHIVAVVQSADYGEMAEKAGSIALSSTPDDQLLRDHAVAERHYPCLAFHAAVSDEAGDDALVDVGDVAHCALDRIGRRSDMRLLVYGPHDTTIVRRGVEDLEIVAAAASPLTR